MLKDRLKQLRQEKKITQSELSKALNVAKTTIASYEQGINEPGLSMLVKISQYFDVTTDYLIGLSEGRSVDNQEISQKIGINDEAINTLRQLKKLSLINVHNRSQMENVNALIGDFDALSAISDYLISPIDNKKYVVCKYYISQNGEDLLNEPESKEAVFTTEQWANIHFTNVQQQLLRLRKEIGEKFK